MYATTSFTHYDRDVRKGDQLDGDDPLVALRPDLFTTVPATRPRTQPATTKE